MIEILNLPLEDLRSVEFYNKAAKRTRGCVAKLGIKLLSPLRTLFADPENQSPAPRRRSMIVVINHFKSAFTILSWYNLPRLCA